MIKYLLKANGSNMFLSNYNRKIIKAYFQSQKSWEKKFYSVHKELINFSPDISKLRFLFGVGRSGTSWLIKVLSMTKTKIRFYNEILNQVNPFFYFQNNNDFTARRYIESFTSNDPLITIFKASLSDKINQKYFLYNNPEKLERNDKDFAFTLHKEVHSLLAIEAIAKYFKVPFSDIVIIHDAEIAQKHVKEFERVYGLFEDK